ncbi:MAG TPA: ParB/RepB/Spo0J family partition protein [Ignavibacteria bacterium]|nr:ParB/RepB/Spo0J family partition protein [Ignavibacteria bacterium]
MDTKNDRLGKGLSAIFGEKNVDVSAIENASKKDSLEIEIEKIDLNPYQPREEFTDSEINELKESIKNYGLLNPITVKTSVENKDRYILVAGERRLRACKLLGERTIKANLLTKEDISALEMTVMAIIENIQRADLNAIELSNAYQTLMDSYGLTQEQLAEKVSKQRSTVANILRLQKLPSEIKVSLRKNEISEAHARILLRVENKEHQLELWKKVVIEKVPVRKLEEMTKGNLREKKKRAVISPLWNPSTERLEDKLRKFFGTRVKINQKSKDSGEIVIEYYSNDDLDRILEKCDAT